MKHKPILTPIPKKIRKRWDICPRCRKKITERREHETGYARGFIWFICGDKMAEEDARFK